MYDVIIIGAGPGGIFSAYELMKQDENLKIAVFDAGHSLEQRHCPIDGEKVKSCIGCKTCAIMNGFGGAGAFSDGKYNITNDFGGEPVQIKDVKETEEMPKDEQTKEEVETLIYELPEDETVVEIPPNIDITDVENPTKKFYVNGIEVVQVGERVQYYGKDGKLITESLVDYTKKNLKAQFATMDDFIKKWSEADKKSAIIDELIEQGVMLDELREEVKQKTGKDLSVFDLICHVTFDTPPLSRKERAEKVKKRNYFGKYSEKARKVLNALIDKFADDGIEEIENREILKFQPFDEIGTPMEIIKEFGGKTKYEEAIKELEKELFNDNEVA